MEAKPAVDAELDRLIEKRAGETPAEAREALWKASVRRHHEAIRRENRAAWYGFHESMSELHARISAEHAEKAEKLCEDDTKGAA